MVLKIQNWKTGFQSGLECAHLGSEQKYPNRGFVYRCETIEIIPCTKATSVISLIITILPWTLQTKHFPPTAWLGNTNILIIWLFRHYTNSVESIITLIWLLHDPSFFCLHALHRLLYTYVIYTSSLSLQWVQPEFSMHRCVLDCH